MSEPPRLVSSYPRRGPMQRPAAARPRPAPVQQRPAPVTRGPSPAPPPPRQPRRPLRWLAVVFGTGALLIALVVVVPKIGGNGDNYPAPSAASLAGLTVSQRIVTIAESQVGYSANPSNSYCNKYSAYWNAGSAAACPAGEKSEEWCADFAAWAWQQAGVGVTYGYAADEISGAAASFYEWAVANGAWHPATSGYVAAPGDVAVYGLSFGAVVSAAHVAVVTSDQSGQAGPDVVNGDGDRTGFSVVETGTDQVQADTGQGGAELDGYVSPPA